MTTLQGFFCIYKECDFNDNNSVYFIDVNNYGIILTHLVSCTTNHLSLHKDLPRVLECINTGELGLRQSISEFLTNVARNYEINSHWQMSIYLTT